VKTEINPVVATVIVVIVVAIAGWYIYSNAGGKTFTKSEVSGSSKIGLSMGKK
jgi:hypothetical protein